MKKLYCYECCKEMPVYTKPGVTHYYMSGVPFDVEETNYYCEVCHNQLFLEDNLMNELSEICNKYNEAKYKMDKERNDK